MTRFETTSDSIVTDAPLHVHSLRILGLSATRHGFVNGLLSNLFQAKTTDSVLRVVQEATGKLQRHDIFDEIKVYLDSSQSMPDSVDVTIHLKEKSKGLLKTAVGVGENEASVNGSVSFRNLFGGAETLTTTYAFGNRTKAAFEVALGAPIQGSPDLRVEAFVHGAFKDYSLINHYDERQKSAGVRFQGTSVYGQHQVKYALIHRDITGQPKASATVRGQTGENLKSSVFHAFVHDHRDDTVLPKRGHYLGIFHEIAGVGHRGDAHFIKHEISAEFHHTLLGDQRDQSELAVVFSTGIKAGFLTALDDNEINVSDRFYLGGPLSVRGFKMGGIGPRDGNDALGGDAFWAIGARITSSLPGIGHLPVKVHAFFNAGNITSWKKGTALNDAIDRLSKEPRTSTGVGLVFHHKAARVEANFCMPLRFQSSDLPQPGFQLGLGLKFL